MKERFDDIFKFTGRTGHPASFGDATGTFPFFTSSQEKILHTESSDREGPALVFGTGGSASVHYIDGFFSASNDCFIAVPKNGCSESTKFYYHYLRKNMHLLEAGFRGAGLKHISKSYLSALPLPTASETTMRRVVEILDKVEAILRKRERVVAKGDEFLKSVYLQMLGHLNPDYTNWPTYMVEELADKREGSIRSGPFGSALRHGEFVDEGIAVLGIDNAVQNRFAWGERRFITGEKYEGLRRYRVFPNDVIVTIMGTPGRSAVVPEDIPTTISTKHLATITCNLNLVHPEVLSFAIHSDPAVIKQINKQKKGAIMSGLSLGIIRKLGIKLAPMKEQKRFVAILLKTREMMSRLTNPISDGSVLSKSLSQSGFRGEI